MNKLLFVIGLLGLTLACTNDNLNEDFPPCDSSSVRYSAEITDIFSNNCLGCHGTNTFSTAGAGINLTDHSVVKDFVENGRLMATIEQSDSVSPMPMNASKLDQCNIDKIKTWINEGAQNN